MSSPIRKPQAGDGLAKTMSDYATPVKIALASVVPDKEPEAPVIPFSVIDAPGQRAYAVAVYVLLLAWRLYDYSTLITDDADSLFYFMKWATIDGLFMYGLPVMRIPWLEWSGTTSLLLFVVHAIMDWLLMFRVPIPLEAWLIGLTRILYDREVAVSERKVKPGDILRNSALILGRQTIHILPEGSATLNPEGKYYCLDSLRPVTSVSIRIDQINPVLIELARFDLDTNENYTVTIPRKQTQALVKQADRKIAKHDSSTARSLDFQVKQTGLYRLQKVVDESGLEVQSKLSEALVVACPSATIKPTHGNKCKGELSNLVLEVVGTPPLQIKYSRLINKDDRSFSFQSIQPENLVSPLTGHKTGAGILTDPRHPDLSWARPHRIEVPLNESLNAAGTWLYSIEEVHDACGNVGNYSLHRTDHDERGSASKNRPDQTFRVHTPPQASLVNDDSPCSLKVGHGRAVTLPIVLAGDPRTESAELMTISYKFWPADNSDAEGKRETKAIVHEVRKFQGAKDRPQIREPGVYTLDKIRSEYCEGNILEPTSCVLTNPPEPSLSIRSEDIHDTCAGNAIGLLVDLDLTGTPPFDVHYEVQPTGGHFQARSVEVGGLRHQLDFRPLDAGHYTYRFKSVGDGVYKARELHGPAFVLEQDVKPLASAHFSNAAYRSQVCIDESVALAVVFQGESPWSLEYELVRGDKRDKRRITDITSDTYEISTGSLRTGGEYTVALVSVQGRVNCKVFLSEEVKIDVRQQRPKAAFGLLEGKHTVMALEGKTVSLPVRLSGQGSWTVCYRNNDDHSAVSVIEAIVSRKNDYIDVSAQGVYELLSVRDSVCPGVVEEGASRFDVRWIARPTLNVSESAVVEKVGDAYAKKTVCEGDEDTAELALTGNPPYHIKYQQRVTPEHGSMSVSNKELTAGLGVASIRMETSQAGTVEYQFSALEDALYDHPKPSGRSWSLRHHEDNLLIIRQLVHPRPSANFAAPGKTYRYCRADEEGAEIIPLVLQGEPPFYIELGIKHPSKAQPEIVRIPNIPSKQYDFRIPHRVLALGSHSVTVRKVRDANGCQRKSDALQSAVATTTTTTNRRAGGTPASSTTTISAGHVLVNVADSPSITPLDPAERTDYCIGDRIGFTLSGVAPFTVSYTFEGVERRASSSSTTFRRIAERPGEFTVTAVADAASDCRTKTAITKIIHPMPTVRISRGRDTSVDIHEGGSADILFEFSGTPPFEFTYIRTELSSHAKDRSKSTSKTNSHPSKHKLRILETKTAVSHQHALTIRASQEGTYEAIAIRDRFCAFAKQPPSSTHQLPVATEPALGLKNKKGLGSFLVTGAWGGGGGGGGGEGEAVGVGEGEGEGAGGGRQKLLQL
ncbi:MAG: hypothetical protein M1826_000353 [Phylliscum demangeonii]|nr:MAG: hypothetical protein M1826_000353 [Phylliscum demangeonii]